MSIKIGTRTFVDDALYEELQGALAEVRRLRSAADEENARKVAIAVSSGTKLSTREELEDEVFEYFASNDDRALYIHMVLKVQYGVEISRDLCDMIEDDARTPESFVQLMDDLSEVTGAVFYRGQSNV